MERIMFLVEPDDTAVSCMLNPESVAIRHQSGVGRRNLCGEPMTGLENSNVSYLYTGNSRTWIELELLFDVTLSDPATVETDVRNLTSRFYAMTAPAETTSGTKRIPFVRMIWGKSWNVAGIVTDITERLENFTPEGIARRSWLKVRLQKINHTEQEKKLAPSIIDHAVAPERVDAIEKRSVDAASRKRCETVAFNDRLENIAYKHYGAPEFWKIIASYNRLDSPCGDKSVDKLKLPPLGDIINAND